MKQKPLSQTNPYLKNQQELLDMIRKSVESSTAIEGVNKKLPADWPNKSKS